MSSDLPSLTGLRAFEAAALHLSFTRAAADLNVTQAAISHQIGTLEEQLGVRLFVRGSRTLALTTEAHEYLAVVHSAFEELRRATGRLRRPTRRSLLTVSTTPSLAAKWLLTRVAAFRDAHPAVEIRMTSSPDLVDFRRDRVDIAIRFGNGSWPGTKADWLMAEHMFPVCSPRLLTKERPLRRVEDLAHHVLLHAEVSREDWQRWLGAAGLPPSLAMRPSLNFDQNLFAIQAAIDGFGVALGRSPLVNADISSGRLIALFDVVVQTEAAFYIVTPSDRYDEPKIVLFRDWLIRSVADAAGG